MTGTDAGKMCCVPGTPRRPPTPEEERRLRRLQTLGIALLALGVIVLVYMAIAASQ